MPKSKPFPTAAAGKGFFGWIFYLVSEVALAGERACCACCKKVMPASEISDHYTKVHKAQAPGRDWFCKSCCVWTTGSHMCSTASDCLYFGRKDILGFFGPVTDDILSNINKIRKAVPSDKKNCFKINEYWAHHNGPCEQCVASNPELASAISSLGSTVMTDQFGFEVRPLMRLKYSTMCQVCEEPGSSAPKLVLRIDNFSKHGFEEKLAVPDVACFRKDEAERQYPALSAEEEEKLISLFNGNRAPSVITRAEYKALSTDAQEFYDLKGKTAILDVY